MPGYVQDFGRAWTDLRHMDMLRRGYVAESLLCVAHRCHVCYARLCGTAWGKRLIGLCTNAADRVVCHIMPLTFCGRAWGSRLRLGAERVRYSTLTPAPAPTAHDVGRRLAANARPISCAAMQLRGNTSML